MISLMIVYIFVWACARCVCERESWEFPAP